LLAGTIIQGTPYVAVYNNGDGAFYLQGFYGANTTYNIPLFGGLDFWDTIAPDSSFIFPAGQAISRTTYASAFARWGAIYGNGDGSTTFNVPDKTGRASVMKEGTATRLTSTYFGGNSTLMGAIGGNQSATLLTANLPPYTPAGSVTNGAITISGGSGAAANGNQGGGGGNAGTIASLSASQASSTFAGTAQGGASTPIVTVQPTIVCNYIIRII
jgi:microcystin-dependent protein